MAHHHKYLPGCDGAVNVNVVWCGAFSEPAGIISFITPPTPSVEEVKVCDPVS